MRKALFSLTLISFFLCSCSDDTITPNPSEKLNPGVMSVEVNGSKWVPVQSSIVCTFENDPTLGDKFDLRAANTSGSHIIMSCNGLELKSYPFDVDNMLFESIVSYSFKVGSTDQTPFIETAQVTITSHDSANQTVSGTFSFNSSNDEYVGKNGSFSDMVYTKK
jgi:hypothetical protein